MGIRPYCITVLYAFRPLREIQDSVRPGRLRIPLPRCKTAGTLCAMLPKFFWNLKNLKIYLTNRIFYDIFVRTGGNCGSKIDFET
jgi:hypothetical protein